MPVGWEARQRHRITDIAANRFHHAVMVADDNIAMHGPKPPLIRGAILPMGQGPAGPIGAEQIPRHGDTILHAVRDKGRLVRKIPRIGDHAINAGAMRGRGREFPHINAGGLHHKGNERRGPGILLPLPFISRTEKRAIACDNAAPFRHRPPIGLQARKAGGVRFLRGSWLPV